MALKKIELNGGVVYINHINSFTFSFEIHYPYNDYSYFTFEYDLKCISTAIRRIPYYYPKYFYGHSYIR